MAAGPTNNAPVSHRSKVAHLPGAKQGDKIKTGRDYVVEFDDALMSLDGWRNPRDKGTKLTALQMNKYTEPETVYQYGPPKFNQHLDHLSPLSRSWAGDKINEQNPVVETHTTTIFYGDTVAGWQEDKRYPNVGPDFSYIFLTKAYTFNPTTNEFFITEMLDPEDDVFERVIKQDLRYGDKFQLKLISEGVEHDLQEEYQVHWNQGLFSKIAEFVTCSEVPYSHPQQLVSIYLEQNTENDYYGRRIQKVSESMMTQWLTLFSYNTDPISASFVTGSFTVEKNPDTWWWRRPQTSSYFDLLNPGTMAPSNSASGELILDKLHDRDQATSSLYLFMNRLMSLPMVYATPDANGQYTGSYFKKQQENFGIPPARKDLHIITFNNAHGTNKDIQTELRHDGTWMAVSGDIKHTTQALRHFGSISISPGSLVGVPNVDRGLVNHFVSTQATTHTNFNPNVFYSTVGGPNFDDYINETGWTNSYDGGEISYFHWMGNNPILEYDNKRYAKQIYRPTWGAGGAAKVTGSGALNDLPRISSWTISKLEKRKNVIMADINKPAHLFEGTGNSGFVVIPENLHPTIKNNMDYYLRKANIRDRGPRRKNLFAKRPRIIRRRRIRKPNFLNPFRFIRRKFRRFRWL